FGALDTYGLKGAVPDVKGDGRQLDAAVLQGGHQRRAEVQSRRRSRDRASVAGKDRLVAFAIRTTIRSFDIGGQRNVAERVHRGGDRRAVLGPEPDHSPAVKPSLDHLGMKTRGAAEAHVGAWLELLTGVHQGLPAFLRVISTWLFVQPRDEQAF